MRWNFNGIRRDLIKPGKKERSSNDHRSKKKYSTNCTLSLIVIPRNKHVKTRHVIILISFIEYSEQQNKRNVKILVQKSRIKRSQEDSEISMSAKVFILFNRQFFKGADLFQWMSNPSPVALILMYLHTSREHRMGEKETVRKRGSVKSFLKPFTRDYTGRGEVGKHGEIFWRWSTRKSDILFSRGLL